MVVQTKLLAVVGAADEVTLAASVSIIQTAITRPITVTLTLITGVLRGAAPLTIIIPASTSLTWNTVSVLCIVDTQWCSDLQEAPGELQQGSGAEAQG